jgi:streptogramin lyase
MKYLLSLVLCVFLLANCSDKKKESPIVTPTIENFSPLSGIKGTEVTLNGNNFGTDKSNVRVTLAGKDAEIISITNTSMVIKIPTKANTDIFRISVGDQNGNSALAFEYLISNVQVSNYVGSIGPYPTSAALNSNNNLIIAAYADHKILKVVDNGASKSISIIAGSSQGFSDGLASAAKFNNPFDVIVDAQNYIYVSDEGNHRIRKIDASGNVTTLAGNANSGDANGIGSLAAFNKPLGIVLENNNSLLIADASNNKIKRLNLTSKEVTTVVSGSQNLSSPADLFFTGKVYIADKGDHKIKTINTATSQTFSLAGSSQGNQDANSANQGKFNSPNGLAVDKYGNIYVADKNNHSIRRISIGGKLTTLAGIGIPGSSNGPGVQASFNNPHGVLLNKDGNLYVIDSGNNSIRLITFD